MQGERVAHRRLLAVGGDDHHLADRLERPGERAQPRRVDAIVIGDEDERAFHGSSEPPRIVRKCLEPASRVPIRDSRDRFD
jgi:hypothetical protein